MPRVRQILFVAPGPVVWARHLGLFEAQGIEVETTPTLSSDQIGLGLADGVWDVGIGVVDNILAWNADRRAGLKIIAQLERSQVMAFCARPGCSSMADASRGVIAVDALDNGFVLVLFRALARAGIDPRTCDFDKVGGVRQRFEALVAGSAAATILVPPFIDMAIERGCVRLWSGDDLAPAYPGVVAGARKDWIDANRPLANAYVRALRLANAWAMNPGNHEAAVAALVASGYSQPAAARLASNAVPGLEPARDGYEESIALRRESELLKGIAPEFEELVDLDLVRGSSGP